MPNVVRIPVAAGAFDPSDITLTDDTSGALLIKEGSNEYMRIDTTNSAEQTIFANGSSNEYIKIDATSGQPGVTIKMPTGVPLRFQADQYQGLNAAGSVYRAFNVGSANNWSFGDLTAGSPGHLRGYANDIRIIHSATGGSNSGVQMRARGAGTGDTFKIQSDTETNFEIDQDSNATFTLDYGTGSTFKVVDDNASPRTFISITEGSNTRCLIPTFSFNEIKDASAGRVMQLTTSNGIAVERTPLNHIGSGSLTYDQSNDGTAIDIGKTPSFTVVYSSAASAAATSGITLQVTATDFQDGCVAPQYLVLQNQNATHSAKFILDPIGDFAAKETATTGTDAADLIGSGFTLAAGKMAVFTLLACRVRDTGGHYFYCVSLHTKT
jgi:hypothetical protein